MKILKVILITFILTVGALVVSFKAATVEERNVSMKQIKFNLTGGDKMYVIDKSATYTRLTCKPAEAKKYYYKVPEGKIYSGILTLKDK